MTYFIAMMVAALIAVGSALNTSPKPANVAQTTISTPAMSCLTDAVVQNGLDPGLNRIPKTLSGIKKPTRTNVSAGYEIPLCQNIGSCDGPETSDYTLVATHIRSDYIVFPNNFAADLDISDRQLVKQTDFTTDPVIADRLQNRLYRTFCGDWCQTCNPEDVICHDDACLTGECKTDKPPVTLPFRGTFHCDFIFYLEDTDDQGNPQLDENGHLAADRTNTKLPELPADKSFFSVYMRKGAPIPDILKCTLPGTSDTSKVKGISVVAPQLGLSGNSLQFPPNSDNYYQLDKNPASTDGSYPARNTEMTSFQKVGSVTDPLDLSGRFEVYKNLFDPQSPDLLYLVSPGLITSAREGLQGHPLQITRFPFFLLQDMHLKSGGQKTLKLGTFVPSSDWIKKWVQESKPAIYLYPSVKTKVTVKLHPAGYLTVSDPPYDENLGWQVIAFPDGTISLKDTSGVTPLSGGSPDGGGTGKSYPYLYYEAQLDKIPQISSGFVVKKQELTVFLSAKLQESGLNSKEIGDYLEYWMPRLTGQKENYFLIYFLNKNQIETLEPIDIDLRIDSEIRVRTYFKPLANPVDIPVQVFNKPPSRLGNILVEWGGILDTP